MVRDHPRAVSATQRESGGGFSMGSAYFYIEHLIVLISLLRSHYKNPTVFAVEYDLAPDSAFPKQINQADAAYKYVTSLVSGDASRICVAGDSAGATLLLSMLLAQAERAEHQKFRPGLAILLSPWVKLVSELDRDTPSDFLNVKSLHVYATQYAGGSKNLSTPLASPGCCNDLAWWSRASPINGFYFAFGSEEVLRPEIMRLVKKLRTAGVGVSVKEEPGAVHAWVMARLFLANTREDRICGLKEVVRSIINSIEPL